MFDSIQADLNTRLLISNKATTAEAQAGTNDTKYITPKKLQDKLNDLIATDTQSTASTHTVCTFANYTNAKIITISGKISGSNGNFVINGNGLGGFTSQGNVIGGTSLSLNHANNNSEQPFIFRFDLNSKSFIGHYVTDISNTSRSETICGRFSSITNFQIRITSGRNYTATIQTNS